MQIVRMEDANRPVDRAGAQELGLRVLIFPISILLRYGAVHLLEGRPMAEAGDDEALRGGQPSAHGGV